MTIDRIDRDLCNSCRLCVYSCPMDVIRMDADNVKAVIVYPDDCMLCGLCMVDCDKNAIFVGAERIPPLITSWG
ncbi:MAG: ferredoxin family protein [Rhodospirillales bacterium]|nr:ferredoxin family protein [Rhodospirillales bacterium]